jgi:hypothetical protein
VPDTECFYLESFNDVTRFLDGSVSKWGLLDQAVAAVARAVQQRQSFARAVLTDSPVCIGALPLTPQQVLAHVSPHFRNYSPVALKTRRLFA